MLKRFVNKHDLNFIVLSDEKREAFDMFGINTKLFGLLNSEFSQPCRQHIRDFVVASHLPISLPPIALSAGRATFIIDPSGVVRGMCEGVLA